MGFKTKKVGLRLDRPLRPPPLSYHSVSGFCWVLREDNTPCRVHELTATASPITKHRLLGPEGVVEVYVQIGGFQSTMQITAMRTDDGKEASFSMTLDHLRLDAEHGYSLEPGTVFNGFQIENGERKYVHIRVDSLQRNIPVDHYAYSITPCALFIGAGRKPTFLPFEVK